MTVANKPGHRGEHEVSRKTIARGMPGNPGVTVVTTLVCFLLCTRGCGRIRRPAFPPPSEFGGKRSSKTRAKTRGEIAGVCPPECGGRGEELGNSMRPCQQNATTIWIVFATLGASDHEFTCTKSRSSG